KFEATTQLVVVNLSAKDKDGNPIKGLKPTDFTVTEDGKPQTIKVFEYQELEQTAAPAPAPAPAPKPEAPKPRARPRGPPRPPGQSAGSKCGQAGGRYPNRARQAG